MASEAQIGWGAEVHLADELGALTELVEVVSFALPDEEVDEVEVTNLKSPDRRREYISGLSDGGTVDVELNYVPGSATDVLIRAAKAAGTSRAVKFVVPDGAATWQITTSAYVSGYSRGPVAAGDKMSATLRLRITGAQTEAAGL